MEIIIIFILILLNGFFSMSEIAVISARKSKLRTEAKIGNKSAKKALELAEEPDRFLSTIQIGITLIGILTGLYSGEAFATDFAIVLKETGIHGAVAYPVAKLIIVITVTYITLVFGELVPKKIGLTASENIAKIIAAPMSLLSKIATPFVWLLSKSSSLIFKLLNIKTSDSKVTEEEIKSLIQEGTDDGEVQIVEQDIMERVFVLGDRTVDSIMTHRNDIFWINSKLSNTEILQFVQQHPFDIYPVANQSIDEMIGIVALKDLFGKLEKVTFHIQDEVKNALNFPTNMEVYKALEEMKQKHQRYALVFDEFGSFQGVVTLKDILEALVGAFPEEHEEPDIVEREDGSWLVDGQCSFYDFLDYFDMEDLYLKYEYNTVSGLVLNKLEHIPVEGEKFSWKKFSFEIVDMDGARIDKILVSLK